MKELKPKFLNKEQGEALARAVEDSVSVEEALSNRKFPKAKEMSVEDIDRVLGEKL